MLNTLRKLNEQQSSKNTIKEQAIDDFSNEGGYDIQDQPETEQDPQEAGGSNITVINDVDVKLVSSDSMDMKLADDQKTAISGIIDNFRQQVSQTANLEPGITMTPSQIRFDGEIGDFDLHFTFVAGEQTGLYMTTNMTEMTPEFLGLMNRFAKFDQMYRDAMEPLITQRQNN